MTPTDRPKQEPRECGYCEYCITDDGEPYYCATQDLYTFIKERDIACPDFTPKQKEK